jgi:hypothetical protein
MELPFLLGDNTDFPDDIFYHSPWLSRFIIKDDEVEFIEEAEDLDEAELNSNGGLIVQANAFYDREWNVTKRIAYFLK